MELIHRRIELRQKGTWLMCGGEVDRSFFETYVLWWFVGFFFCNCLMHHGQLSWHYDDYYQVKDAMEEYFEGNF